MTNMKMRIMVRATMIRMKRGEALEDILASWPNLTEEDKTYIREKVKKNMEK